MPGVGSARLHHCIGRSRTLHPLVLSSYDIIHGTHVCWPRWTWVRHPELTRYCHWVATLVFLCILTREGTGGRSMGLHGVSPATSGSPPGRYGMRGYVSASHNPPQLTPLPPQQDIQISIKGKQLHIAVGEADNIGTTFSYIKNS